jgi:hypothetical protein
MVARLVTVTAPAGTTAAANVRAATTMLIFISLSRLFESVQPITVA